MNLVKFLRITKCTRFSVFVYHKGHVKEKRGIDEAPIKIFDIERNENGELPEYIEFGKCKVKEIIPFASSANVVVEVNQ